MQSWVHKGRRDDAVAANVPQNLRLGVPLSKRSSQISPKSKDKQTRSAETQASFAKNVPYLPQVGDALFRFSESSGPHSCAVKPPEWVPRHTRQQQPCPPSHGTATLRLFSPGKADCGMVCFIQFTQPIWFCIPNCGCTKECAA